MHRLGWVFLGSVVVPVALGLAAGCASGSSGGTGGGGGSGSTSATTGSTSAVTGATTSASTSASTSVASSSVASSSSSVASSTSSSAMSSSSSGVMIPATWVCDAAFYSDGFDCDCGCGAPDPDCASALVAACDYCDDTNSCSPGTCPGSIEPTDNSKCVMNQPENTPALCSDGIDNDFDTLIDCADPDCGALAACTPPVGWNCGAGAYFDTLCDCGCGVADPACVDATNASCDNCDTAGSCSATYNIGCPGAINATDNTVCDAPVAENTDALCTDGIDNDFDGNTDCDDPKCLGHAMCPPVGWTCFAFHYNDGTCDCGCGAKDVDCPDLLVASCVNCDWTNSCSATSCPGTINPTNNAVCQ